MQGQGFLAGAPLRQHAAGFHRSGNQALAGDALAHDDVGVAKRLFRVAALLVEGERDVIGPLGMHGRGARGDGLLGVGDGLEFLVVHFHKIRGVARDVAVCGHYHGYGMAHVVDPVLREEMMMRHAQSGEGRGAGHGAQMLHVFAGEDRRHARRGERRFGVDGFDVGSAVGAAHHDGVMHAGHLQIVQVECGGGDETRIFLPSHGLAEHGFRFGNCGGHDYAPPAFAAVFTALMMCW